MVWEDRLWREEDLPFWRGDETRLVGLDSETELFGRQQPHRGVRIRQTYNEPKLRFQEGEVERVFVPRWTTRFHENVCSAGELRPFSSIDIDDQLDCVSLQFLQSCKTRHSLHTSAVRSKHKASPTPSSSLYPPDIPSENPKPCYSPRRHLSDIHKVLTTFVYRWSRDKLQRHQVHC